MLGRWSTSIEFIIPNSFGETALGIWNTNLPGMQQHFKLTEEHLVLDWFFSW